MTVQHKYTVSVLMPAYNAEKYIREAIDSVLKQTFSDFEFIIIDDGSADRTIDLVLEYTDERIKLIRNHENKGLIYTLNKGIELSQGKYIARMDADDISLPERFQKQVEYMDLHDNIAALSCSFLFLGTPYEIHFPTDHERIRIKLLENTALLHPGVMLRKSMFVKENISYNNNYKHAEDYYLWVDLALKGAELGNLDDVLVHYRQHEGQVSVSKQLEQDQIKNNIKHEYLSFYFRKHFGEEELLSVNRINDIPFVEKIILLSQLNKVNRVHKYFKTELFEKYLLELMYKSIPQNKYILPTDFLKMLRKNVSFSFIVTAMKINLKKMVG